LEAIEKALNITPPRTPARTYAPDNFNSSNPNRNRNPDTTVPSRTRDENFEAPAPGRNRDDNDGEMFREDRPPTSSTERSFKPTTEKIAIPGNDDSSGTVIQSKKPAPGPSIDDKNDTTLRLDSQITSRAVAPRSRQFLASGVAPASTVVSKSKPQLQVDAQPRTINLARH
jgi:dipeptidyl aminopeptidase/acylaminoacyl peptidase